MIIIIDEASAKLASFYYHDEIFKPQWKRVTDMSSASDELHNELQEKLKNTQSPGEGDGRGIGLKNVQERLHIAFGEMYGLEVTSDPGNGTTVTMCIPVYPGKETIN